MDTRELDGKTGISGVFVGVGKSKSSSKVTHCWAGFPAGGGGWCRGAGAGVMEEGGARGKAGAGNESGLRENIGGGAGLRLDDGPNRDMVLWS